MRFILPVSCCLLITACAGAAETKKRPMELDDMFRFERLSDPQISPDGKRIVYAVGDVDLKNNRIVHHLWLTDAGANGSPRRLTEAAKSDRHPRWSPNGKTILFESSRSGTNQLWTIAVDGGEARQLTQISTGASEGTWSPDGKHIAFVSAVWPENSTKPITESDGLNKKRQEDIDANPVKAKVFTRLYFRHWDEYVENKRQHLFVLDMVINANAVGSPRDVTPGDRDAYPTSSTFSSGTDFTFTPDSGHLLFTAVPKKNRRSLGDQLRHLPRQYPQHDLHELAEFDEREQSRRHRSAILA